MQGPSFDRSGISDVKLAVIASRALKLYREYEIEADRDEIKMDLVAAHANGCPLDLDKLYDFDDFSFMHDIIGINRNVCHDTGKLQNCFVPRCAQ